MGDASAQTRVRFAPSPSGHLHVGGARTALFNWLHARHTGGVMVLRIEDTDRKRSTPESIQAILDALRWLELDWDEGPEVGGPYGPYYQSQRVELYARHAARLLRAGSAYPCFCTPEELKERREAALAAKRPPGYDGRCGRLDPETASRRVAAGESHALRYRLPAGKTAWEDLVRGRVEFDHRDLDDFVILRSDGHAAYNFAVVVDDATMKITDVIRGEDHISNTPRQLLLFSALDATPPRYAHVPLIHGPDRTRLSKRHGATSVEAFRDQHVLPDAMVNLLALLGWSMDGERTFFTRDELIAHFSIERIGRAAAIFDRQKLDALNGEHFKSLPAEERRRLVLDYLVERGLWREDRSTTRLEWLDRAIAATGDRLKTAADIEHYAGFLFVETIDYEEAALRKALGVEDLDRILERSTAVLGSTEPFETGPVEEALRALATELEIKPGVLFTALRVAVTGRRVAPGLFDCLVLAGRDLVLARLARLREVAQETRV